MPMTRGFSGSTRAIKQHTLVVPISSAATTLPCGRWCSLGGRGARRDLLFSPFLRFAVGAVSFGSLARINALSIALMYFSPAGVLSWLSGLPLAVLGRHVRRAGRADAYRWPERRALVWRSIVAGGRGRPTLPLGRPRGAERRSNCRCAGSSAGRRPVPL